MTKIGMHGVGDRLRLVGGPAADPRAEAHAPHASEATLSPREARQRIARENTSAAMLAPDDARWMFAQEVASRLEGGRAALLRPADRRELVEVAGKLGVRAFDANLVIALVQDAARRGEDVVLQPDAAVPSQASPGQPKSAARGTPGRHAGVHSANAHQPAVHPRSARTPPSPRLDLVSRIDADANEAATRRLQALLAMVPLRAQEARDRVIDKVIASVVLGVILLITLISLMGP
jgi:hypothetical protein